MKNNLLLLALTVFSFSALSEPALTGYKGYVKTTVYEDGSISRRIELVFGIDEREDAQTQKDFFIQNGYRVNEHAETNEFHLVAEKVCPASSSEMETCNDAFSKILLERKNGQFTFTEDFQTQFIRDEIAQTDLKDDRATVRVLMAELQYRFITMLPGKITSSSSGQFHVDTCEWHYDVEQLLTTASLKMTAQSELQRQDHFLWGYLLAGVMLITIGILIYIKLQLHKTTVQNGL